MGDTGFVPFFKDGTFNEAAWTILSDRPQELQGLRNTMLNTSLQDFSNLGI